MCFANDQAKTGIALAKAMALRAVSCNKSRVRQDYSSNEFMAAARLDYSLDSKI